MRPPVKILLAALCLVHTSDCRTFLDAKGKSFSSDYMTIACNSSYNEFDYFNKVNSVADKAIFYTTHFTVRLPKNIVHRKASGNTFYFESPSRFCSHAFRQKASSRSNR